jgi:hypothetical protein
MRVLVIGSRALQHHRLLTWRKAGIDTDIISSYDDAIEYANLLKPIHGSIRSNYPTEGGKKVIVKFLSGHVLEAEIAWPGTCAERILQIHTAGVGGVTYASIQLCYMLKMSHRYLKNNPHFMKTMRDIRMLRKLIIDPQRVLELFVETYEWRMRDTYTYSRPNLNQGKSTFFNSEEINYLYDHDSLHLTVAQSPSPAYKFFMVDNHEVLSSKAKFEQCSATVKLNAVLEEAYVLALERSQIPHPGVLTPRESFLMALEKVCTSITSGWFREFAWENYDTVLSLYSENYVDKFRAGLAKGLVVPFKG